MQPVANEKTEPAWNAQEQDLSAKLSKKNQHLKENIVILAFLYQKYYAFFDKGGYI